MKNLDLFNPIVIQTSTQPNFTKALHSDFTCEHFVYIHRNKMVTSKTKGHFNHIDSQNRCCSFACQRFQLAINAQLS